MYHITSWILSQCLEVTDKVVVVASLVPSFVFSVDIQPVVLSMTVSQALEITNNI